MSTASILASLPIFKGIQPEFAEKLNGCSIPMTKKRSEVILVEGEEVLGLYIIVDGSVQVHSYKSKKAISQLVAGDIFGEMAMIEGQKASATIRAASETANLILIHGGKLKQLLVNHPEGAAFFYQQVSTLLSRRLRDTTQRLFDYIDTLDEQLVKFRDYLKVLPTATSQREISDKTQELIQAHFAQDEKYRQTHVENDVARQIQTTDWKAQGKMQLDQLQVLHRKWQDAIGHLEKSGSGLSLLLDQMYAKTPELKGR